MKKKSILAVSVIAALLVVSTAGYSWNYATHAYIAGKIGRLMPLKSNQVYGIMAPDLFNLEFSTWSDNVLRAYTHGIPKDDPIIPPSQAFMKVWFKANGLFQRMYGFGYVAHNDAWGADYIAHWKAIPPPPNFGSPYEELPPGYIIALAVKLDQLMDDQHVWDGIALILGAPLGISDRIMFTHNIIEYAGDILIKRADSLIGKRIYEAALDRTEEFPDLLREAFPPAYTSSIGPVETAFNEQMKAYGQLLWMYDEDPAIHAISDQLAQFAVQYLEYKTGQDLSGYETMLAGIAYNAMYAGVEICQGAHYMQEVNITSLYVALQLLIHRVSFFSFW